MPSINAICKLVLSVPVDISVVLVTYNRLDLLKRALASVIAQRGVHWECFVINDHPETNRDVADICCAVGNERIAFIECDESRGANYARNLGLRLSKSVYVAFLDDDDVWCPKKLYEHHRAHLRSPEALMAFSGIKNVFDGVERRSEEVIADSPAIQSYHALLAQHLGGVSTTSCVSVARGEVLKIGGFDETLPALQDWDLWYRLSKQSEFIYIPQTLVEFHHHLGPRITVDVQKRRCAIDAIFAKFPELTQGTFRRRILLSCYMNRSRSEFYSKAYFAGFRSLILSLIRVRSHHDLRNICREFLRCIFSC